MNALPLSSLGEQELGAKTKSGSWFTVGSLGGQELGAKT